MVSQPKLSTFLGSSRQQHVYIHNYMYVYTYIICTNICAREHVHGALDPPTSLEGVPLLQGTREGPRTYIWGFRV